MIFVCEVPTGRNLPSPAVVYGAIYEIMASPLVSNRSRDRMRSRTIDMWCPKTVPIITVDYKQSNPLIPGQPCTVRSLVSGFLEPFTASAGGVMDDTNSIYNFPLEVEVNKKATIFIRFYDLTRTFSLILKKMPENGVICVGYSQECTFHFTGWSEQWYNDTLFTVFKYRFHRQEWKKEFNTTVRNKTSPWFHGRKECWNILNYRVFYSICSHCSRCGGARTHSNGTEQCQCATTPCKEGECLYGEIMHNNSQFTEINTCHVLCALYKKMSTLPIVEWNLVLLVNAINQPFYGFPSLKDRIANYEFLTLLRRAPGGQRYDWTLLIIRLLAWGLTFVTLTNCHSKRLLELCNWQLSSVASKYTGAWQSAPRVGAVGGNFASQYFQFNKTFNRCQVLAFGTRVHLTRSVLLELTYRHTCLVTNKASRELSRVRRSNDTGSKAASDRRLLSLRKFYFVVEQK